jgi:hypothetical protein
VLLNYRSIVVLGCLVKIYILHLDSNNEYMHQSISPSTSCVLQNIIQGDRLDSKEQYCLASCQDRYLDIRKAVGDSLEKKQSSM